MPLAVPNRRPASGVRPCFHLATQSADVRAGSLKAPGMRRISDARRHKWSNKCTLRPFRGRRASPASIAGCAGDPNQIADKQLHFAVAIIAMRAQARQVKSAIADEISMTWRRRRSRPNLKTSFASGSNGFFRGRAGFSPSHQGTLGPTIEGARSPPVYLGVLTAEDFMRR